MKLIIITITILLLPIITTAKTVVIDPGHGGKSPGAVYARVMEKTVNLKIALLVEQYIRETDPSTKIILTRRDDRDVALSARTDIANRADADLFVSIHCNANPSTAASGSETYVMGIDKSGANLSVAMAENAVISLEDDQQAYGGYDPKSAESFIIFSLMQYAHQDRSLHFASALQRHYGQAGAPRPRERGVKQAGFLVLWRTAMPSVLTEVGFLSNDADRAKLSSSEGQQAIARAIARAATAFLAETPQQNSPAAKPAPTPTPTTASAPKNTTPKTPSQSPSQPLANACPSKVKYYVQIKTSPRPIEINSLNFGPWVIKIIERKVGNLYKYWVGEANCYKEALNLQSQLRPKYPDCFVVAAADDKQITLSEAKEILEKSK